MQKEYKQTLRALFLTALPVEYQAVHEHLHTLQEVIYKKTVYEQGIFTMPAGSCKVGLAQVAPGNSTAATEAERAITWFSPDILCFVGVAGGIKDVQLGDVVVATDIYNYEAGKAGVRFFSRPKIGRSSYDLIQRAQAEARKLDWLRLLKGPFPRHLPSVIIKPLAAGEKVLTSTRSTSWRHIRATCEDAVAVEMEGYGFLQAAYANQQVSAIVIRGISDLIEHKDEADAANYQQMAARHASAFAFQIVASFIGYPEVPISPIHPAGDSQGTPFTSSVHQELDRSIQNHGTFSGFIIQENNGVQHFHQTIIPTLKENYTEGKAYLQRGHTALLQGDYTIARQCLSQAIHFLDEKQFPTESAQVRFLQSLALLNGKYARNTPFQTFKRIEELMGSAVALLPTYSYLYTFALILRAYAWNGFPTLRDKADALLRQAREVLLTSQDQVNIDIVCHCQPRLVQDAQSW